jgi:tetratricopeptide (TPR) repeat protein
VEQFGQDHPQTLAAMNNLATSHRHMGDFRSATTLDKDVWARRQLVLGETHPHTLASGSNLGRDIRDSGEFALSADHLRSVSEVLLDQWGPNFRTTLTTQANLAVSLRCTGEFFEAANLLENAYERLNDTFGPKGPDTLACRLSRAVNMLSLGQVDDAASELEALQEAYELCLDQQHPHALLVVSNLAMATRLTTPSNTSIARKRATTASAQLRKAVGPNHPYTLATAVNLAICMADDGDYEAALASLNQTATELADVLGADHPDTIGCEANTALLSEQLRMPGFEALLENALERLVLRLGRNHPSVDTLRQGRLIHWIVEPHPF